MAGSAVLFVSNQLSLWLNEERKLLGGLEAEVEDIQGQMRQMSELLRVADANEESNPNLKEWVRQVREISYDVEDVLDKYMFRFRRHRYENGFNGFIKKAHYSVKNLKGRHQIASEVQAIKKKLRNVLTNQQILREVRAIMDRGSASTIPKIGWHEGRGDALFLTEADVVGIEKPKKQLLKWIWSENDGVEVISVVGMPGVGKTTLVKKVYDDESVKMRFTQHVWVVASDHQDVKHLLVDLIKKLVREIGGSPPQELEHMSVDEMRDFVFTSLKENKNNYIIVLDDVWNISIWDAIGGVLPNRDIHGCIIITTRFEEIGKAACSKTNHVYSLEPLPVEESKVLFYRKAFPRDPCPSYITDFAESILQRCGGLPLAIVVIGGLLATKNYKAEEWELFSRSISYESEDDRLNRLWRLFSLSYNDLPYYLKYCFLYLSIFPEGGLLEKERIVRLWIAEGFVQAKQNMTIEEVAQGYLNELFSRSLIQVAGEHIDGRSRAFRIHDLLREYIISKSREQNIVTISTGDEKEWPRKIRRLAVQKSLSFSQETDSFENLRSLLLLHGNMGFDEIKELLGRCRLLKLLDLGGAPLGTIPDEVFKLYHLKYLSLRNTTVRLIPKSIKYLDNLETLDLKDSYVTELPAEILKLHKLRHLLVYRYTAPFDVSFDCIQSFKSPCKIGTNLPLLQKLLSIEANEADGIKIVREVGKLTQLRRLGITKLRSEDGEELCRSIAKLTNLRSLRIDSVDQNEKLDLDYSLFTDGLPFLRTLYLSGCDGEQGRVESPGPRPLLVYRRRARA